MDPLGSSSDRSGTWLKQSSTESSIGLKINGTKAAILGISQKKQWFLEQIANKVFHKAEQKWGIKLTDENRAQFLIALQAAMEVKDISDKQRYTIVWRFAQGLLGQSGSTSAETVEQPKVDGLPSSISHGSDGNIDPIVPVTTLPGITDAEALGRDLLTSAHDGTVDDKNHPEESGISDIAAQVQNYDTQTAALHDDLNAYRTEAATIIENEQKETPLAKYEDPRGQHDESMISAMSVWDPVLMANIPEWETRRVNWLDENWATQVQCTHLPDGDFVLSFPDGERIIIDSNWDREKAEEEIRFIQEVAKTPIVRRLLNMWTDAFYRFRERVAMRYDPEWKTSKNPEQLIKLMLEAILKLAMNGENNLHDGNKEIRDGEFRDPTIPLALIQSRLYGSANQEKRTISEALSEQWIFDIQSRRFNTEWLIARI